MKNFKRILIILGILILLCILTVGGFLLYALKIYPDNENPVSCGAKGENFEIMCYDDVPVLWSYGLPYPSDYEHSIREVQSMNGTWTIKFDPDEVGEDQEWFNKSEGLFSDEIQVPSCYNTNNSDHRDYEGIVWYKKEFRIEPSVLPSDNEFLRLCFRGVLLRSKVWINGQLIGKREGGYTPFYFDVTDKVNLYEQNTIVVKTDNRLTYSSVPPLVRDDHSSGWWQYGGIYRDVYIEKIPKNYIFKVMAEPEIQNKQGIMNITILTHSMDNSSSNIPVQCKIFDNQDPGYQLDLPEDTKDVIPDKIFEDVSVYRIQLSVSEDKLKLWSPDHPNLYMITVKLLSEGNSDEITFNTGFRTIDVSSSNIYLNDEPIFLRGISRHEDDPEMGATQTYEIIKRDYDLLKDDFSTDDLNANYVRMAHYPHSTNELIYARDNGILLSEEIAYYQVGMGWTAWYEENKGLGELPLSQFGMKQLHDPNLLLNAQRELIEMVERDRNNPAIIMWSVSNECYTLFDDAGKLFGWMRDVVRAFDDTRPVTLAEITYCFWKLDNWRTSARYMDIVSINSYFGWYYGEYANIGEYLDHFREMYPNKPIILSEFGAGAHLGRSEADGLFQSERVYTNKTYSEEYQAELISTYMEAVRERDYVVGVSPWVFADFLCPWFPSNPVPMYNVKGILSKDREKKQGFISLSEIYNEIEKE